MVDKVIHYRNNEFLETTLYSYVFIKKGSSSSFYDKYRTSFPKIIK